MANKLVRCVPPELDSLVSAYFAWMSEHAAQVTDIFDRQPFEPPASAGEGELVGTNCERKYRREEGRVFNGMVLVKKG